MSREPPGSTMPVSASIPSMVCCQFLCKITKQDSRSTVGPSSLDDVLRGLNDAFDARLHAIQGSLITSAARGSAKWRSLVIGNEEYAHLVFSVSVCMIA